MHTTLKVWLASALVCGSFASFAQTPAAAPAAAAMQNFVCKDGTSVSAASAKGTCAGHKGIDKDATAKASAAPATPAAKAAPATAAKAAPAPAAASKPAPAATAAVGGGPGQVWVNEGSKVYHCQGDRYYGKTKAGKYMSEADAKAAGAHGANNKTCA